MSQDIITEQELNFFRKKFMLYAKFWLRNPVSFIYNLGIARLLPYQAEILQSVVENKRTIVKSGHGAGKTFIMALAACWWLCLHWLKGEGCSVIVTSPSAANLNTVFWAQFSKCMDLLPNYFKMHFTVTNESAYENEDSRGWRIDLRTARKENPDAMQGQHNVLFLVDEWSGVPIEIYRVIEGAMSDAPSRILAIGNPVRRSGWGYEAFTKNKKLWHSISIDCSEYTVDKEFKTVWTDILGEDHDDYNNGRVDKKEVKKWLDMAGGNIDGYDYRIRVRGEFPMSGKNQFISLNNVKPCFKQGYYSEQAKVHTLGLDPATSGGDEIALVHRWGSNIMAIWTWQEEDTRQIAYQVRDWLSNEGSKYYFDFLAIDAIGDGKGVYDSLDEMREQGVITNVRSISQFKSSYEAPDKERYDRLRDYVWDKMKKWFINEAPHFPEELTQECENLQEELVSITSDHNTYGKLKIESKKDMKKRGVKSPNIADALSMTFHSSDDNAETIVLDRYQRRIQEARQHGTVLTPWNAI